MESHLIQVLTGIARSMALVGLKEALSLEAVTIVTQLKEVLKIVSVARRAGEVRPRGIAQYSTNTESDVEGSFGEAGSWHRADDTTSAGVTTVAKSVGESWPLFWDRKA